MDIGTLNILPVIPGNSASASSASGISINPPAAKPSVTVQPKPAYPVPEANAGTKDAVPVAKGAPLTNVYVVSDEKFTIFKDPVGYVTKYTSLIDGHVTYIPDQNVARFLEAQRKAHPELQLRIEA